MLKLSVGLTKKVGQENYGSKGASVNVELELDSGIISEPERLRERIKQLFTIAKSSVDEELNGQSQNGNGHNGTATTAAGTNGNGHSNGNGHTNGNGTSQRKTSPRRATASQARALHVIADRQGIDLAGLLRQRFSLDQAGDLSITEASAMIDELKNQPNGVGGHR